jgi:hypothetical protein
MIHLAACLLLSTSADATEWKSREINPKRNTDFSAYTVQHKHGRLGLTTIRYGLMDNVDLGINNFYLLFGAPNLSAKVTAIQTKPIDVSLQGQVVTYGLGAFGVDGQLNATPLGWTASWKISEKTGLHAGSDWLIARVNAELSPEQLGDALGTLLGTDITKEFQGLGMGAYAGANVTIAKTRFAFDWRLNGRDTLVVQLYNYTYLTGIIASGGSSTADNGTETSVGATARITTPLSQTIPTTLTISWQWSWRRLNLRVGAPISTNPASIVSGIPVAFKLNWLLGRLPDDEMRPKALERVQAHDAKKAAKKDAKQPGA